MFKKQSPEQCPHASVRYTDRFRNSAYPDAEFVKPLPNFGSSNEYIGSEATLLCPNSNDTSTELSNKRPKNREAAKKSLIKIAKGSVCDGCVLFNMTKEECAQVEDAKKAAFIERLKSILPLPKPELNPDEVVDLAYKVVEEHTKTGIENIEDFANRPDTEDEDDTED